MSPSRDVAWALLILTLLGGPVRADEPKKEDKKDESASERVPTDEEAKAVLDSLQAVVKRKKSSDILKSMEGLNGLAHREFLKPLSKLLSFEDSDVAIRAAALLEKQKPRGTDPKAVEKEVSKAAADVWKAGWAIPANDKRPRVRGATVRILGAWGVVLDDRQFGEVERLWRQFDSNPDPLNAFALTAIAGYAQGAKDKRFCRRLAEWLDEPGSEGAITAATPPAEWFERKWKIWDQAKETIRRALKAITGEDFKSTADAKAWFERNEKTFGFKW